MDFNNFKNKFEKVPIVENNNNVFNKPLVSVCVQTYQHVNYIKECLDGILMQQTKFDFEILLGEDSSTDGTKLICEDYANKFPKKIRFFSHNRENNILINGKPSGRFNMLYNLFSSKGKYIALCEGDDYWTDPLKLQKQVDFLEANLDYNICFHEVKVFNQEENKFSKDAITRDVSDTTNIEDLARGNFIHTPSVILRNNFTIPKWFSKSPIGDWPMYMIAIKDKNVIKLDDVMAIYRVHDSSIWSGLSQKIRNIKTRISVKLVLDNLKVPNSVQQILNSRIPFKKKNPTIIFRVLSRLKRYLK